MTDFPELKEQVLSAARHIENEIEDPHEELDPLEIKVEASIDGEISEIIAVLTTGGPHIEVALYAGHVDGWWGGEETWAPIRDEDVEDMLRDYADYYRDHWEENVLA